VVTSFKSKLAIDKGVALWLLIGGIDSTLIRCGVVKGDLSGPVKLDAFRFFIVVGKLIVLLLLLDRRRGEALDATGAAPFIMADSGMPLLDWEDAKIVGGTDGFFSSFQRLTSACWYLHQADSMTRNAF
jgi:hypothetical protein